MASTSTASSNVADTRYTFDSDKLEDLRKRSPWKDDPKWFESVSVSPTAIVKMMTHCQSGVEKGVKKGGNPIEVMGLLLGRPDPLTPHTLVVTDVFPLPIEGFETRVIADDQDVINHMITLGESLENTRKEKFMGWYHSHPFDYDASQHSHCFLSQTDISTQLQWQRMEDPHGNPFLAMVVDPLRSLAKEKPNIKAFRAYPPDYESPVTNQCPDGSIIVGEKDKLEQWGSCWSRYYELDVDYFMSNSARNVMDILTKNLWMRNLGSTASLEPENRNTYPERIAAVADKLKSVDASKFTSSMENHSISGARSTSTSASSSVIAAASAMEGGTSGPEGTGTSTGTGTGHSKSTSRQAQEIKNACDVVVDFAAEKIHEGIVQVAKKQIFS